MFKINKLINIKPIFRSAEYFIDGFSLMTFLSGSTAPLEAACLKQHVRLIQSEEQALRPITNMITHFCVRDAFQPHESMIDCAVNPPVGDGVWVWLNKHTQYPRGASVRASHGRNVCCSAWLSEIHLKLWLNCEVTISRLHPVSSIRLTIEDNVIHLPTSSWLFLVLPH